MLDKLYLGIFPQVTKKCEIRKIQDIHIDFIEKKKLSACISRIFFIICKSFITFDKKYKDLIFQDFPQKNKVL